MVKNLTYTVRKVTIISLVCILSFTFSAKAETLKKETMGAKSLDAYKRMNAFATAGNQLTIIDMMGKGEVMYLPKGAKVKVLDTVNLVSHNAKKIKVIKADYYEDELKQSTFWVDEYWLK